MRPGRENPSRILGFYVPLAAGVLWLSGGSFSPSDLLPVPGVCSELRVDVVSGATRLARFPTEIKEISTHDALTFRQKGKQKGIISYHVSKPAWIRVLIVGRGQKDLLLRTLVDWQPRAEGSHTEAWDGMDASGNALDPRRCFVVIEAQDWAHRSHDWSQCREVKLCLIKPDRSERSLRGRYPFKLSVCEDGPASRKRTDLSVRFYVDSVLKATVSYPSALRDPLELIWDTGGVEDGEHLVTFVGDDRNGHFGTISRKVVIRNSVNPH